MHLNTFGSSRGRPVLLLHGGGVAGWMWNALAKALQAEHLVLVPDLPGHGESAGEPYRSHEHTVTELARMVTEAAVGPAAVVGFSLGAQLTVKLASEHPELVDRVVVVSAQARPMPFTDLTLRSLAVASPLARRRWFARLQARELFVPQELMKHYIATSVGISRETMVSSVGDNLRFGIPAGWSEFPGRALILAGQRERKLMRQSAATLHAALPGSELEIVPECGHGIPFQRPEWFHTRVTALLDA
ncbi:alpha/beta fold hydrolase [Arthrobacter sp. JZ12]|uniref:alpha/beta fold hydrolase n=1 Tax=Arthrobacter sp. JZ12 TaxID=2654190 RepID=UPI002B463218|nr:alpha/beta hydrolase [Arthrobacter sp. JZ12]WRH24177.1 alpha/beta fold hydrolase [Arthrobacter sp. JZ12]